MIEKFNGDRLSFETGLQFIIDKAFIDGTETTFTDKLASGEAISDKFELLKGEDMEI